MRLCNIDTGVISIHALVKRATQIRNCEVHFKAISIHALVKRATNVIVLSFKYILFQSTPS